MKKQEPDPAIFYALHDAAVSTETALRRAGYKVTNPRSVINQKYKLLARRPVADGPVHPAVAALSPQLRAQWKSLAPQIQEWYLATTTDDPILHDPKDDLSFRDFAGDMEMLLSLRLTGDFAPKKGRKRKADGFEKRKTSYCPKSLVSFVTEKGDPSTSLKYSGSCGKRGAGHEAR